MSHGAARDERLPVPDSRSSLLMHNVHTSCAHTIPSPVCVCRADAHIIDIVARPKRGVRAHFGRQPTICVYTVTRSVVRENANTQKNGALDLVATPHILADDCTCGRYAAAAAAAAETADQTKSLAILIATITWQHNQLV